ncbi:hypothetical protein CCC_02631 [Paramagnetospirillum magnetotacticum MS-1]|uniref:VOC domain-containing protein n=1 Tax=Paramagnetospirillum magnetotacticum MS-1 TaxID=272627 RepID=A0A0C2UEB2_PARME|nr:hypothetical protein CCC_02631 [Paramagnetospirillum magnetotacticum MS-1]
MQDLSRRVTPLTVSADIAEAVRLYQALGFEVVDSGNPGWVGLRAGHSHQILASKAFMERRFSPWTVAVLLDHTTPYIYVSSLDEAKARLSDSAAIVEQSAVVDGSREAVIDADGLYLVLAEKVEGGE